MKLVTIREFKMYKTNFSFNTCLRVPVLKLPFVTPARCDTNSKSSTRVEVIAEPWTCWDVHVVSLVTNFAIPSEWIPFSEQQCKFWYNCLSLTSCYILWHSQDVIHVPEHPTFGIPSQLISYYLLASLLNLCLNPQRCNSILNSRQNSVLISHLSMPATCPTDRTLVRVIIPYLTICTMYRVLLETCFCILSFFWQRRGASNFLSSV